jgi:hypothetical protein
MSIWHHLSAPSDISTIREILPLISSESLNKPNQAAHTCFHVVLAIVTCHLCGNIARVHGKRLNVRGSELAEVDSHVLRQLVERSFGNPVTRIAARVVFILSEQDPLP